MKKNAIVFILTIAVLIGLSPGISRASGAARTHDGFFLRMGLGLGYARTSTEISGIQFNVYGGDGTIDLAVGYSVIRNLSLHASLLSWTAASPTLEWQAGGITYTQGTDEGVSAGMNGLGIGLTYHFPSPNLYLSAALGGGKLSLDDDDDNVGTTDGGTIFRFLFGKEWWVSDNWGLGLSGLFDIFVMPAEDQAGNEIKYGGFNLGLMFSATYN